MISKNQRLLASGSKIGLATHNQNKHREISALLEPFQISVQKIPDLPEIEETASDFCGNSRLKAHHASIFSNMPVIADDSGLSIDALGGRPGIYSARWAGEKADFNQAMQMVWQEWKKSNSDNRNAAFICALCLAWPDGRDLLVEGRIEGSITWPARGKNGFGYDPIFIPKGHSKTFAEMTQQQKQKMSHRRNAFDQLFQQCFDHKNLHSS